MTTIAEVCPVVASGVDTHFDTHVAAVVTADAHRLLALISYPAGADPAGVTAAHMAGPAFAADMDGFDAGNIINVEELLLDPPAASPLSEPSWTA